MAPLALTPLVLSEPLRDDDLLKAIALLCSPVFSALSMANALGGGVTNAWRAVREHSLTALVDEAIDRGLSLDSLKASCCDLLVLDTPPMFGVLNYDPRPKCLGCGKVHLKRRDGELRSCASVARFSGLPEHQWTRTTIEQALKGRYPDSAKENP